ncbi:hypothetical protein PROFUN_11655 [Planoprotostelium fungivorum]|uniref:3'-phosphate/5'-hydroxy nucleic acid ligase n=1 Tax=Planoprotostelium fungivorum TaxID=1890364 RepID=A0A2P6N9R3_9EUKA|nr:hypothetical protein PROFUN_11655 [Planoprotostelium fungivorum]
MPATQRINICRNGNMKDGRTIMTSAGDWQAFLKAASNKFKMKAKRAFTSGGYELTEEEWNSNAPTVSALLSDAKSTIVVSDGKDFVGFIVSATEKEPEMIGTSTENEDTDSSLHSAPVTMRVLSHKTVIEEEAVKQLEATSKLPNVMYAIGMPDLHPGKGFPIGSATASHSVFYPHLVGSDIGCGMTLTKTSIRKKNVRPVNIDRWVSRLHGLEGPWDGEEKGMTGENIMQSKEFDNQIGTIGGGNHFAELQEIESVVDRETFERLGMDEECLYLLAHSGSRSLGYAILDEHTSKYGQKGIRSGSEEARDYLEKHDYAVDWAKMNREIISLRFLSALQGSGESGLEEERDVFIPRGPLDPLGANIILDIVHNSVVKKDFIRDDGTLQPLYLHRKGAAPSDVGPVVIPGSRGAFSYLVLPSTTDVSRQFSAYSLAHGAGRKWARGKAQNTGRGHEKTATSNLTTTSFGSKVICEDVNLLFEEQPDAYKEITSIIDDLVELELISVIAILKPIITYKSEKKVGIDLCPWRKPYRNNFSLRIARNNCACSLKHRPSIMSEVADVPTPLKEEPEKPWVLLLLVAHSCFGLYFGYDTLSALQDSLSEPHAVTFISSKEDADTKYLFSMTQIAYALSVLCLVFFGGALYDFFGARRMLVMTTFINTTGMFIIANTQNFYVMMAGQFLFAAGCCYLYFVVITLMGGWFRGPRKNLKMNIAIGSLHCWLRIGSFGSYYVLPRVDKKYGLRWALYLSFFICLSSFASAIMFVIFDLIVSRRMKSGLLKNNEVTEETKSAVHDDDIKEIDMKLRNADERGGLYSTVRILKFYWNCYASLPMTYWMISFVAVGFVSSLFTFTSFGVAILKSTRQMSAEDASSTIGFLPISNGLTTALVSTAIGLIGGRTWFAVLGAFLTTGFLLIFAMTPVPPLVVLISLGVIQSLMDAVIFPCIAIVVPKENLSYAISLTIFLYNVGLFGMAQLAGNLADKHLFTWIIVSFVSMSLLAIVWKTCVPAG